MFSRSLADLLLLKCCLAILSMIFCILRAAERYLFAIYCKLEKYFISMQSIDFKYKERIRADNAHFYKTPYVRTYREFVGKRIYPLLSAQAIDLKYYLYFLSATTSVGRSGYACFSFLSSIYSQRQSEKKFFT